MKSTKPVSIEKRSRVVQLRTANPDLPVEIIALRLGISKDTAGKIIKDAAEKKAATTQQ
jgi:hypothetical protein